MAGSQRVGSEQSETQSEKITTVARDLSRTWAPTITSNPYIWSRPAAGNINGCHIVSCFDWPRSRHRTCAAEITTLESIRATKGQIDMIVTTSGASKHLAQIVFSTWPHVERQITRHKERECSPSVSDCDRYWPDNPDNGQVSGLQLRPWQPYIMSHFTSGERGLETVFYHLLLRNLSFFSLDTNFNKRLPRSVILLLC